jgi:hypothetical protein
MSALARSRSTFAIRLASDLRRGLPAMGLTALYRRFSQGLLELGSQVYGLRFKVYLTE